MTRRKQKADRDDVDEVRVLPHNLEAERGVLGAILVNDSLLDQVDGLQPDHFFRLAHRLIFHAMRTLVYDRHAAVDIITLRDLLESAGELEECGGAAYLAQLADGVPRSVNIKQYAGIVREKAALRSLIHLSSDLLAGAYDENSSSAQLITEADKAIIDLQRGSRASHLVDVRTRGRALTEQLEHMVNHKGELTGITTGFPSIDELTLGWQRGDLVVVAARPSIGKTVFALNTAVAAALAGHHCAIFSLEMRLRQLEMRLLSQLSGVPATRIQTGYLGEEDFPAISQAVITLEQLPIWIDDRGGLTAWDIRSTCRRLKAEHGLDLVVIDYVQLMPGTLEKRGATRNEEVTDISRRVKALADELNVPILLLSQLSRAGEGRRPILSDLRESGALEQDADVVLFLHREKHRENGTTEAIFDKQRQGSGGTRLLTIAREIQRFTDGGELPAPATEAKPAKPRRPPSLFGRRR